MPAAKKSTRKCAAPKRKPAAKRKSSTTTRRKSATATRSRSRSCSSSRCATPRRSTSAGSVGCGSSYMRSEDTGRCGPVACVDSNGYPLRGFVRDSQGNCAPKKCGAGYVFNPATGKCVSQNTYAGQKLLAVKKYNDAFQARADAQKILDQPPVFTDPHEQATFQKMLGGSQKIASVQREFMEKQRLEAMARNTKYEQQLQKLRAYDQQRASASAASCPTPYMPFSSSSNPWVRMGMM